MITNINKICNKCGDPSLPPQFNHCENCWYGQYQLGDNYQFPFYHQEIQRFVPPSEDHFAGSDGKK